MFVGEAPGRDEDLEGLPFVGRAGKLLDRMLAAIGLDRTPGLYRQRRALAAARQSHADAAGDGDLPAVHPPPDRAGRSPTVLVCLGGSSTQTLLGVKDGILKTRGRWFTYQHRQPRDPRDRDPASGLSAAPQRSLQHFSIGKDLMPREMIASYAVLKKAAAIANYTGKRLGGEVHDLVVQICDEILSGQYHDMFPLHVWMTGSGTQFNMNVNEVISNRCCQLAGLELEARRRCIRTIT